MGGSWRTEGEAAPCSGIWAPTGLWASEMLARYRGSIEPINFLVNHAGHLVIRALTSPVVLASRGRAIIHSQGGNGCQQPQPPGLAAGDTPAGAPPPISQRLGSLAHRAELKALVMGSQCTPRACPGLEVSQCPGLSTGSS